MKEAIIQYNEEPDDYGTSMIISWKELVRCKDCNNRGTSDCPIEELCKGWIPSDDWFCADGVRRNESSN